MDVSAVLSDIGLSDGESKVYLALLKLGSCQVSRIKEETGLHRTTIYDFVEKLLNKGLISHVIKNNVKYFSAAAPEKLLDYVKEKETNVNGIMAELKKLNVSAGSDVRVEVYKGIDGFKTVLNDIIRVGKDLVLFGIDEREFKKRFPILMDNYFAREKEAGIKERILTSEEIRFQYDKGHMQYRRIPTQYFSPTPIIVYGDKVLIHIFEPFVCILIENKDLADSYRKYFEMLWGIAKA